MRREPAGAVALTRTTLRLGQAMSRVTAAQARRGAGAFCGTSAREPADNATRPTQRELAVGDHVASSGNTRADRMQHDGSLETELQRRFPKHRLSVRNLGFSATEAR